MVRFLEFLFRIMFRMLLSISSTSLLPVIYLVKSSIYLVELEEPFAQYNMIINIFIYLIIVFMLFGVSLFLITKMDNDSINNEIKDIKNVDNEYLPIYLAYFFVALSIPTEHVLNQDLALMIFIYTLICVFLISSKTLSFNPIFIIFGYSYYLVKTQNGKNIFVLTRKKIGKNSNNISFPNLRKISEIEYYDKDN